jgi:predicted ATPase/transcriptional regulator with XRE-family HTH domain/TolA-binding protein
MKPSQRGRFAILLHRYRQAAGLTQEELAERADLSARAVSDLERGVKTKPRPHTVRQLTAALGLAPGDAADFASAARGEMETGPSAAADSCTLINLQTPPTRFFGRTADVAALLELLSQDHVRLVTLSGTGGSGKTRLALEVGKKSVDRFGGGVAFVPLAPVADSQLVLRAIATVLGVQETAGATLFGGVVQSLSRRNFLLILDNFEHVLEAAGEIAELLAACERLTMLVTSRAPLHLVAEREYPVPPMPVPQPGHGDAWTTIRDLDAVQLFVDRVQAVQPAFALTEANAHTICAICHRLDGLPLAIELAAARSRVFPLATLEQRLEQRLPLLSGGARDLPARQRTLRGTIDWSFHLLAIDEQHLFARLSIFAGGCTVEAAGAVCTLDDTLDIVSGLTALVEHNLVRQVGQETPRFAMLETIREYAAEQLATGDKKSSVRRAHALYFVSLAEEAERYMRGPQQIVWFKRLDDEQDNLRAALVWAADNGEIEVGLRLASAMEPWWSARSYFAEGSSWLERLLQLAPTQAVSADVLLEAYEALRWLYMERQWHNEEIDAAERTVALAREIGDEHRLVRSLASLGAEQVWDGNVERGGALLEEARGRAAIIGNRHALVDCMWGLVWRAERCNEHDQARRLYEEALALYPPFEATVDDANAAMLLGGAAEKIGDPRAQEHFDRAISLFRAVGNRRWLARALEQVGYRAWSAGNYRVAAASYEEAARLFEEVGDRRWSADARCWLGVIARDESDYARARDLLEQALMTARQVGDPILVARATYDLAEVTLLEGDPGRAIPLYQAARDGFAQVAAQSEPVGEGLARAGLGFAHGLLGEYERALSMLREAADSLRGRPFAREALLGTLNRLGEIALAAGDHEQAQAAFLEAAEEGESALAAYALAMLTEVNARREQASRPASS